MPPAPLIQFQNIITSFEVKYKISKFIKNNKTEKRVSTGKIKLK